LSHPLRIFLCCQQAQARHPVPAYAFWERYFKNGLAEAGHECVEAPGVDWAGGLVSLSAEGRREWLDGTWSRALEFLREEHSRRPVGLFLSYLFPDQVEPAAVRAIRDLGVPCVNFFCDNVREFRSVPGEFGAFDLNWVPEAGAIPLYRRAKFAFLHAPMPCWVDPQLRRADHGEEAGPTFIGSRDDLRAELLAEAIGLGASIQIHGVGWVAEAGAAMEPADPWVRVRNQEAFIRRHGGKAWLRKLALGFLPKAPTLEPPAAHLGSQVSDGEYIRLTQRSEVTVGINRYPDFRHPRSRASAYSRLRDVEAPMLGACYLTEWTEDIPFLYEPGDEIETYRSAGELAEKIAMLHSDRAKRTRLRARGQRRALESHSVGQSIASIARTLGLPRMAP
jgi:hypothetical protein